MKRMEKKENRNDEHKKTRSIVQPYLAFEGRCEEALEFYRKAVGAEVTALVRFKDSPDPGMCAPGAGDKIMHSSFSDRRDHTTGVRRPMPGTAHLPGFFAVADRAR
jgi:hypothetical protein